MSWFGGSGRNRRRDRRAVPEVRLQSRTRPGPLGRAAARLLMFLTVAAAVVLGVGALVVAARDHWLHRIEALAVRRIEASTDGILRREEILQMAGVQAGRNILAIDLPSVQASLLRHPRVAGAELRRELPDTLRLEVRERFPVLRVPLVGRDLPGVGYLLDESGFVLLPAQPGQVQADVVEYEASLPVLVGARMADFKVGGVVSEPSVRAALQLLAAHAASRVAGQDDIVSIDISRPPDLKVVTTHGSLVTFTPRTDDPAFHLAMTLWETVLVKGRQIGKPVLTLDLSITNNIPVLWREEAVVPEPEPVRPARPRRRPAPRNV